MNEPSATTFGFVRQIVGSIRKHRGEPALVIACFIAMSVVYLWAGASLHLRTSDVTRDLASGVVRSLLPFFVAVLLLQFAVVAWRIYRRQQIVITTKETLLHLDEVDRAGSERRLQAHRKRLEENIAALTTRLPGEAQ